MTPRPAILVGVDELARVLDLLDGALDELDYGMGPNGAHRDPDDARLIAGLRRELRHGGGSGTGGAPISPRSGPANDPGHTAPPLTVGLASAARRLEALEAARAAAETILRPNVRPIPPHLWPAAIPADRPRHEEP